MTREWTDERYEGVKFRQSSAISVIGFFDDGIVAYHYSMDPVDVNVAMDEIYKAWLARLASISSPVANAT